VRTLGLLVAVHVAGIQLPCAHAQSVDTLPLGWERTVPLASAAFYTVQLDRQVRHGGLSSMRVHADAAGASDQVRVVQTILADDVRGRRVRLTGYARVADAAAGGSLWMRIDGSATGTPYDGMRDRLLRGTSERRSLEIVLDVPADATRLVLGAMLRGVEVMVLPR